MTIEYWTYWKGVEEGAERSKSGLQLTQRETKMLLSVEPQAKE